MACSGVSENVAGFADHGGLDGDVSGEPCPFETLGARNPKPTLHNLQLLLSSSCLYSSIMPSDTSPFRDAATTSGPATDLDTLLLTTQASLAGG